MFVHPPVGQPRRWSALVGVPMLAVLFLIVIGGSSIPSQAAITFDAASRTASTTSISSLSWFHNLGAGTDRYVIIGVACENSSSTDANITSVTFNGVTAMPVPNSKIFGGGTGIIQTQLFFLPNSSLSASGTYTVRVTF